METPPKSSHIHWQKSPITREDRIQSTGLCGATLWFTGLSGSGKSTVAIEVEKQLLAKKIPVYRLDGDNIRHGLNRDLGFSPNDRKENIRRISEVSKLLTDAGVICLVSFISPYQQDRDLARQLHTDSELPFIEVFVDTPLQLCEKRDPKGLYKKARAGEITEFTGISAPYEAPTSPELTLNTTQKSPQQCALDCIDYLNSMGP